MGSEIKVGLVFFLGMVILFVMTVVVSDLSFFPGGYTFPVYFENVAGLEKGNRVLLSGVNVGTIGDITIERGRVCVVIRIDRSDIFIPADSEVGIEQASLLAGMQVSIVAGKSDQPITEIKDKQGVPPISFTKSISEAADSAKTAIDDIRSPLTETIENLRKVTGEIKGGDGTAHKFIYEKEIYENIRVASEKLKNVLTEIDKGEGALGMFLKDGEVAEDLKTTLKDIKELVAGLKKGEGTAGKFLKDDEVYEDIRGVARDAKEAVAAIKEGVTGKSMVGRLLSEESGQLYSDLKDTASEAKKFLGRLNEGKGIAKLFSSDKVYDDIEAITSNLKKVSEKLTSTDNTLGKILNEAGLYEKAEKVMEDVEETLGVAARMRVEVHLSTFSSYEPFEQIRYQMHLKLWPHAARYFLLGGTFTDMGDDSPLIDVDPDYERKGKLIGNADFQLAWVLGIGGKGEKNKEEQAKDEKKSKEYPAYLTLRTGLIEGRIGGGFDLDFWRYFRLTGEGRDRHRREGDYFEDIRPFYARAYLSMKFLNNFRIYAGADNIADKAVFSFGFSLMWEDKDIKGVLGLATIGQ